MAAPDALAAHLRAGAPPVIGRVAAGCLVLDMLAVGDDELPSLAAALNAALDAALPGAPEDASPGAHGT